MPDPLDNLPPQDRRGFFAEGLRRLMRPLADAIEKRLPESFIAAAPLRPPGALPEIEFLDTCHRCGRCAESCPADAITLSVSMDDRVRGTPTVTPARQACVVCDELACMKVCPSGALRLVDRFAIRMGLARVDHAVCVRSSGEPCVECIYKCPLGAEAIRLDRNGRVEVINPDAPGNQGRGCIGCGICEQYCPTTPAKAIAIVPGR
ncbi:quinol dehydrogenase periplasmic component [Phycisphaerae bacterium RAS2]|nr:quinol dehydrogenase periplasmic component [Phycisphaerae bacterium RAS2]